MQVVICCPTRSNIMTGRLLIMNAWYLHRLVSNLVQQLKLTHIFVYILPHTAHAVSFLSTGNSPVCLNSSSSLLSLRGISAYTPCQDIVQSSAYLTNQRNILYTVQTYSTTNLFIFYAMFSLLLSAMEELTFMIPCHQKIDYQNQKKWNKNWQKCLTFLLQTHNENT